MSKETHYEAERDNFRSGRWSPGSGQSEMNSYMANAVVKFHGLEIALNDCESSIYQKDISKNQQISYKYLDQILSALKASGFVAKAGGRKSGYVLTRKPSEITVYDVHNAFIPGICVIDCLSTNYSCERETHCASRGFWGKLNNQIIHYFKSISLQDLINEQVKLDDFVST